jgi:hypothetical protein
MIIKKPDSIRKKKKLAEKKMILKILKKTHYLEEKKSENK